MALTGDVNSATARVRADLRSTQGAAQVLLGHLCRRTHRKKLAAVAYKESLAANAYMWGAVTSLCHMGAPPRERGAAGQRRCGTAAERQNTRCPGRPTMCLASLRRWRRGSGLLVQRRKQGERHQNGADAVRAREPSHLLDASQATPSSRALPVLLFTRPQLGSHGRNRVRQGKQSPRRCGQRSRRRGAHQAGLCSDAPADWGRRHGRPKHGAWVRAQHTPPTPGRG